MRQHQSLLTICIQLYTIHPLLAIAGIALAMIADEVLLLERENVSSGDIVYV